MTMLDRIDTETGFIVLEDKLRQATHHRAVPLAPT
jgi:hypothetical protein